MSALLRLAAVAAVCACVAGCMSSTDPHWGSTTAIDAPMSPTFGHAVATMFGADPKSEMDDDLMRMKSFIETGHQPHDAAERQMHRGPA